MKPNVTAPLVLTLDETCSALRLSKTAIYALAKKGELPKLKIGGATRFRRADVERLAGIEEAS